MKIKITIIGSKVHDIGYRPFLIAMADEFELDGFRVRNTTVDGIQAVLTKAEGEDDCIGEFEEAVKIRRPEGAVVSSVESEPFDGLVTSIERAAITNMHLQLYKGVTALTRIDGKTDKTLEKQDETVGILKEVKENTASMLEKQDETIEVLSDVDEKMGRMLVRQDETTEAVKDIQLVGGKIARIEQEIKAIKTKIGAR